MSNMIKCSTYLPIHHYEKICEYADFIGMPKSRVLSYLVDNALSSDIPLSLDMDKPNTNEVYPNEGAKMLEFLKGKHVGIGLDILILLRHSFGVSDREKLLAAFHDCLENKVIIPVTPKNREGRKEYPNWYKFYKLHGEKKPGLGNNAKRRKKKINEYEQYLRLKSKYGKEA